MEFLEKIPREDMDLYLKECRLAGFSVLDRGHDYLIGERRSSIPDAYNIIRGGWRQYACYHQAFHNGPWLLYDQRKP